MKCPKCKETIIFDDASDTYYCEQCGIIYDREELENKPKIKVLLLSFLLWIPIVNWIIIACIEKSSSEDKKTYYNVFLSSIMMNMLILVLAGFTYKWYVDTRIRFARQTLTSAMDIIEKTDGKNVIDISEVIPKVETSKAKITSVRKQLEEQAQLEAEMFSDDFLSIINGGYITGEQVRFIMEQYPSYGYLLQTDELKLKYQNVNLYLNVGRNIKECGSTSEDKYRLIDCSMYDTFTLLYSTTEYNKLDTKNTIYYIYDSEMFKVQLLYDKDKNIVGLSFTELEV